MKKLIVSLMAVASVSALAQSATERRLDLYDQNLDGRLSLEELRLDCEISKSLFDQADKNSDGVLSLMELRTAKAYVFRGCSPLTTDSTSRNVAQPG